MWRVCGGALWFLSPQVLDTNADPNDVRQYVRARVLSSASHPTLISSDERWVTSSGVTQLANPNFKVACLQCAS